MFNIVPQRFDQRHTFISVAKDLDTTKNQFLSLTKHKLFVRPHRDNRGTVNQPAQ